MSIFFISDVHICPTKSIITNNFIRFLKYCLIHADALYILGDLFEVWIGDDDPEPLYNKIAIELQKLKKNGIPCYFIHGNRDFLLGKNFANKSGIKFLPEQTILKLYDHYIFILHGDTLCTDDKIYQLFRYKVHNLFIQKLFLSLPLFLRLIIASKIRSYSKKNNHYKSKFIMDVNLKTIEKIISCNNIHYIIHGHTHKPGIHKIYLNNKIIYRIVLSSWHDKNSMIKINKNKIELILF